VVVNLYDFAANPSIEEIDIGGPSLLRAAAKNYKSMVVAVCDPEDYVEVGLVIKAGGTFSENFRFRLAAKAFEATARYDRMIADYMNDLVATGKTLDAGVHHH
ncbi:MAG: bifunctional phosphoribosylaminoimidazolecarboxamide formyltransferase/IMP cyclohydrolase, partial [Candidatus Taylorbacteria bacterium]|nr:bifunctional phosphoribosylaminoimidazolecarboxamide formyltransferase/IMP cyclohydrolase [Candidatus Taylorbacteria bacterium]